MATSENCQMSSSYQHWGSSLWSYYCQRKKRQEQIEEQGQIRERKWECRCWQTGKLHSSYIFEKLSVISDTCQGDIQSTRQYMCHEHY